MRSRFLAGLCLASAIGFGQQAIRVKLLEQSWLVEQLQNLPTENAQRQQRLRELFEQAGCKGERLTLQPVKRSKIPNIICTLPGQTTETVVVGAHFDKVPLGKGTVDNGTGLLLLPALYVALARQDEPRHHTFQFVGFTDEEIGLVGSSFFARSIPKEDRPRHMAMVNIDTLGLGPATVWHEQADPQLRTWLEKIVQAMRIPGFRYVNVDRVGDTDSSSFKRIGVPVIDFHSITSNTHYILHSVDDNMKAVKPDDYFGAYRMIAYYLAFLDDRLQDVTLPPSK